MHKISISLAELKQMYRSPIEALELLALIENIKPCIRFCCYPDETGKFMNFWKKYDLVFLEADFKVLIDDEHRFVNKGIIVDRNDPRTGLRLFYVSKDRAIVEQAKLAEMSKDYLLFGNLLGYPRCCSEYYVAEEPARGDQDFIVPLIKAAGDSVYPFANNILRRDDGLTLIFHFPCSLACSESEKIGLKIFNLIRRLDPVAADTIKKELCKGVQREKLIRFG